MPFVKTAVFAVNGREAGALKEKTLEVAESVVKPDVPIVLINHL
jgi:hypothetical protein